MYEKTNVQDQTGRIGLFFLPVLLYFASRGLHDAHLPWLWLVQSAPPSSPAQGPGPPRNTFTALVI